MKNISDWYPPSKYVFYPLYKFYRRDLGLNMYISNFATWVSSAILHTTIFLPQGHYTEAIIFGGIFLGLGTLTTGAKILEHKFPKNSQSKSLDEIVR